MGRNVMYLVRGTVRMLVLASVFVSPWVTAAPNTIAYNGKLTGKDGVPLKGAQVLVFSLCDQVADGNCPWKEQRTVTFINGAFSIQLGEVTPLPANLFDSKNMFLSVALSVTGGAWEAFSPRQPLTAAPYAMNANDVLQKDISPRSVSISGYGMVIDSKGNWVGPLSGSQQGTVGPAGPAGPAGPKGDSGMNSLIALLDEPAGTNCVSGGKKVTVGLDLNSNSQLDAGEISSAAFVCHGLSSSGQTQVANKSALSYGWTQTFGGMSSDDIKAMALDAAGNLYVTGNYSAAFDGLPFTSKSSVFVRKYSAAGQLQWSQGFGNTGYGITRVTAIAVQPQSGRVYLAGSFSGSMTYGSATLSSVTGPRPYVLQLDSNGGYGWMKTFGDSSNQGIGGVADLTLDEDGSVYYAGVYGSDVFKNIRQQVSIDFNPDPSTQDTKVTLGRADMFVSKLDKDGYYQWTYLAGLPGNAWIAARIKAKAGVVYVAGKDRTYNKIMLTKLSSVTGAKTGEATWSASGFPYLAPTGIAVDSTGGVVLSAIGSYFGGASIQPSQDRALLQSFLGGGKPLFPSVPDSFSVIQKFDGNLSPSWTYIQGAFGSNGVFSVALDSRDNIYFGGEYTGDLINSESTLYDPRASTGGTTDLNLVKLSPLGKFQWAETVGGYGRDRLQGILINGDDIFLGGFISGGMDMNFTHSSRQYFSSRGTEDAFVSNYKGVNN